MESQSLIESFTEDQQMQVYSLMSLGDIEDINLAAQLLLECDFDVNVFFKNSHHPIDSSTKTSRHAAQGYQSSPQHYQK
jgi:hypothetical protein